MEPPNDIDTQCIDLCVALNKLPGIQTFECCCGHGEKPYRIYFVTEDLKYLPPLLYYFAVCHCGFGGWKIIAYTDCGMCPARFRIEGPIGEEAYEQSKHIAELINKYIDEKLEINNSEEINNQVEIKTAADMRKFAKINPLRGFNLKNI